MPTKTSCRLVKKTLYIGFFAYIIGNFNSSRRIVFNCFAGLGLKAAGSAISTADFLRPGRFAQVGLDAGQPLLDAASQLMGFTSFFDNFVQIVVLMVAWLVVLIAFFILAVQLFVTLIEFKLTTLAGFVLIPFGLFGKTAFLAEKVLGNVVASGIKVMVLAVIVGIGTGLFSQFTTGFGGTQPTIEQTLSLVLAALALLGLGIFGPGIATGLVSGAPQLGAGAAVGTGLAVAGAAWSPAPDRGGEAARAGAGRCRRGRARRRYARRRRVDRLWPRLGRASGAAGVAAGLAGVGKAGAAPSVAPVAAPLPSSWGAAAASQAGGDRASPARPVPARQRFRRRIRTAGLGPAHEAPPNRQPRRVRRRPCRPLRRQPWRRPFRRSLGRGPD